MLLLFYRTSPDRPGLEECFYIDAQRELDKHDEEIIRFFLDEPECSVSRTSMIESVEEVGPRLAVESTFSSTMRKTLGRVGVIVDRFETSLRRSAEMPPLPFDPMTQERYSAPLQSFGPIPERPQARIIPLFAGGKEGIALINKQWGSGLDPELWDFYRQLFEGKEPSDAAVGLTGNSLSEHCRHGSLRARPLIDGVRQSRSTMTVIQQPWKDNPGTTLVAFHDSAGVIRGHRVRMLMPEDPTRSSVFVVREVTSHITMTAETHNHPSYIAPVPGAETGVGGEQRDADTMGLGPLCYGIVGIGYATSNPRFPNGYRIAGCDVGGEKDFGKASALEAIVGMSEGGCDYANKLGRPVTLGWCRAFDQYVGGVRRGWVKPICYVGSAGRVDERHLHKKPLESGMLIIGLGGSAREVGVNGGAASSFGGGDNSLELDFASVQRAEAIEQSGGSRVLRGFAEMGDKNPVIDLSDQGAGGPGNLFLELVGKLGGQIDLEKIACADPAMSSLARLIGEYQERYGFVIRRESLGLVERICKREEVKFEVLGEITGDGRFVVVSKDGVVVDLQLAIMFGELPEKHLDWKRMTLSLPPLVIPEGLTVRDAMAATASLLSVGSKGFLVRKGDRSVGGDVGQQQCVGPKQVPAADCAIMADSMLGITGSASALGEQPIVGLIDAEAGARMSVAEMLTNICSSVIAEIPQVGCRVNEMCSVHQPGEGARFYDGVRATADLMSHMRFAPNGGKDSLSMHARTAAGELVVAPGQIVVFGTAPMDDIRAVCTPDLKGGRLLGFLDIGAGKNRLGGSALAQSLGQLGNEAPDIDNPDLLNRALGACQQMMREKLLTAYHDRSDGGLAWLIGEMCIAGNRGAQITIPHENRWGSLFSQEAGVAFEYAHEDAPRIKAIVAKYRLEHIFHVLGQSGTDAMRSLTIKHGGDIVLRETVVWLRQVWEATSDQLEMLQANPETVAEEIASYADERPLIPYRLTFDPDAPFMVNRGAKPRIAVLRAHGTNGDRELTAAYAAAGFEVQDMAMSDIMSGEVSSLSHVRHLAFAGGFADGDACGSAKGWAASILFNERVREMFWAFYERPDSSSFGVCNGCQALSLLRWVPGPDAPPEAQIRLVRNKSARKTIEARWAGVRIMPSKAIMGRGMENSVLGVWVANGEGRFRSQAPSGLAWAKENGLIVGAYVDPAGEPTESYPYNPSSSPDGIAGMCSPNGRHVSMMPHGERAHVPWQMAGMPESWKQRQTSPWLRFFRNVHLMV